MRGSARWVSLGSIPSEKKKTQEGRVLSPRRAYGPTSRWLGQP